MAGVFNKDWQTVLGEKDDRIAELEQENERLRSTIKIISQFWDWCRDSDKQQYPEYNKIESIRAELEK